MTPPRNSFEPHGIMNGLRANGGLRYSDHAAVTEREHTLRCPDDSPLFVAVWYLLAIAIVALTGRVIGARLLRW